MLVPDHLTVARMQANASACALSSPPHRRAMQRAVALRRSSGCAASSGRRSPSCAAMRCQAAAAVLGGCSAPFTRADGRAFTPRQPAAQHGHLWPRDVRVRSRKGRRKLSPMESNEHKRFLAKYVNEVDPSVVDSFPKTAPPFIVEAMRSAVSGLVGNMPVQFFEVTISSVGDNMKSLMYSFLMTGYLFRNVEHHLELKQGLDRSLPASALYEDGETPGWPGARFGLRSQEPDGYAPGANLSGIQGQVTRWRYTSGPETIPADEYIEMLESEVRRLKEQLKEVETVGRDKNRLMDFMSTTPHNNIHELRVSSEVNEAMQMFLQRLLGTTDQGELSEMSTETNAVELSRLLLWLLIVGYTLRNMEVRLSMEQSYALPYVSLEDKGGLSGEF